MSGGGKGGKQSTEVEIPKWLEDAAKSNMAFGEQAAGLGFRPYFGADIAAPTPMQQAAFANTGQAANAFGVAGGGMTGMEGMPTPQTFEGGVQGYSSAPMYEQSLAALQQNAPGQYDAIREMFINPQTGAQPAAPFGAPVAPATSMAPVAAASVLPTVTDHERRMGLTPEAKARGMTLADYMGR
jgi:hypothetical protein